MLARCDVVRFDVGSLDCDDVVTLFQTSLDAFSIAAESRLKHQPQWPTEFILHIYRVRVKQPNI